MGEGVSHGKKSGDILRSKAGGAVLEGLGMDQHLTPSLEARPDPTCSPNSKLKFAHPAGDTGR